MRLMIGSYWLALGYLAGYSSAGTASVSEAIGSAQALSLGVSVVNPAGLLAPKLQATTQACAALSRNSRPVIKAGGKRLR
jgi:hypothetical protein